MQYNPNPLGWIALVPNETASEDVEAQIIPENDIRPHDPVSSCWCNPTVNPDAEELMWNHNALDGREDYFGGKRKPH